MKANSEPSIKKMRPGFFSILLSPTNCNSGYADVPWVDNDGIIIADRIKALGEAGITFDQFYASPTCSPSRAAALTGLYPIHTGFNVSGAVSTLSSTYRVTSSV